MKNQKAISIVVTPWFLAVLLAVLLLPGLARADWLKMTPPPDVDKVDHNDVNPGGTDALQPTCWIGVASNMLAGAGYGDGGNVQERADDIYDELCNDLVDGNNSGWADTAMNAWLPSKYNTWPNNPYTVVTFYGHRNPRPPWANTNLPKLVGNKLRECNMVRLSIRKPTCNGGVGAGGHAITTWGDEGDSNDLTDNPDDVKVSDTDYWNSGENVQTYTYDDYNDPNPDGCNEGNGWYIDYSKDKHWYIDGIVTLAPTTDGNNPQTQKAVASTKIHYDVNDSNALDLHYTISTDSNAILSYRTTIDYNTINEPNITEQDANSLRVRWDLSDNPVEKCTWITITAEIVIPYDPNANSVSILNVLWTPLDMQAIPGSLMIGLHDELVGGSAMYAPNSCGGYVVSAFEIYADSGGTILVGEYRSQHEYKYYQDPEYHEYFMEPESGTYWMGNFRFGHSYALLLDDELQQFNQWLTYEPTIEPLGPKLFVLDWTTAGLLPYPQGQVHTMPAQCGDEGTGYFDGDINKDCYVDFRDFALLALGWLECSDPNDPDCV